MRQLTRRTVLANAAAGCSVAVFLPMHISTAKASEILLLTHRVEIRKFKFVPDRLSVKLGDTIVWTNFDIAPHTATANDESWDTGIIKKGQSVSVVVNEVMANKYFCRYHPHMKAGLKIE